MEPDDFFTIDDPAECLLYCYRQLKRKEPGISHRFIIAKLGLKSSGAFARMLAGKFLPSPEIVGKLAKIFALTEAEREHLAWTVELRRLKDPSIRRIISGMIRRSHLMNTSGLNSDGAMLTDR